MPRRPGLGPNGRTSDDHGRRYRRSCVSGLGGRAGAFGAGARGSLDGDSVRVGGSSCAGGRYPRGMVVGVRFARQGLVSQVEFSVHADESLLAGIVHFASRQAERGSRDGGIRLGAGGLMARLLGIPLVLHEQNRIPGTTNRWLARRAQAVLEAFPDSFAPKLGALCTGNPVRQEIVFLKREIGAGWDEPLKILVLGGSQGARALNEIVPEALARVEMPIRVFHQTGEAMRAKTAVRYAQLRLSARIEAFVEDMAEAYAWADLVVCRSGAMTISELTAAGLPSILVPYPYAIDDHQTHNARYLVDNGAAVLIPQAELSAERLAEEITALMQEPARLKAMAERASALAKPDAAQVVAEICLNEVDREAA